MRAVLALDLFDTNKHSGIISAFRQKYIKTKIFEASFSDIIGNAFRIRNRSDYEDFYIVSKHEAAEQLENAGKFLHAAETYLSKFLT